MGVLLPNDKHWLPPDWVAMGFFSDSLPYVPETSPDLAEDIRFCIEAEVDTLDLRSGDRAKVEQLAALVERVFAHRGVLQGNDFHNPECFPFYMKNIEELKGLLLNLLDAMR